MAGGRPRVLDEMKQREVCALVSAGCSLQAAADYVECAPNTIRREIERDAEFGGRFRAARLAAQLNPLRMMRQAAANHWRAAAWLLERTDPDQFARQPSPAFRAKQARALEHDVLAILSAEIENPLLLGRLRKQIRLLIHYSIDGVVHVERTNRQLRAIFREIDALDRDTERHFDSPGSEVAACPADKPARTQDRPTATHAANGKPVATDRPHTPMGVLESNGQAQTH